MFPRSNRRSGNRQRKTFNSLLSRTWLAAAVVALISVVSVYVAFAAISISTSVPFTENFDSMGIPLSNPAPSALPANFKLDTISQPRTLGSWGAATNGTSRVAGANMATNAASGSYNFGAGTASLGNADRAAGFISSGTATMSGNLYAELSNDTGNDLIGIQAAYDVEKYRNGSNPSGYRIQLYYSLDGLFWTNAGPSFFTGFAPNVDNSGFATAPGATVSVNNTLNVAVPSNAKLYLAWNYSVTSGFTTTNAQALAIDNISLLGLAAEQPTNPTGVGTANPNSLPQGAATFLTVAVTPGANPTSLAHTVTTDLSSIGGSSTQQLFDDGTNGDVTSGDNIFSFNATVANGTTGGLKNLPFTINEVGGQARVGNGVISLGVLSATDPSGIGAANPNSVLPTEQTVLTINVSPGTNPPSTGLAVAVDLSSIGGTANQQFFNDGVSGGDVVANDNVFTYTTTIPQGTTAGAKSLGFSVTDGQGRSGNGSIALTVQQPPPPVDHVVISQIYGGGGNSGATFTNDYVELYNPTGVAFNLAGWSLQYASAAGTSWTNKQPIGGTIAPGEYFLVSLASGGANGAPLPVSANISGDVNMSATTGKVALVNNSINLNGSCPNGTDPDVVDFVGYGTSASCFEGAGRAPAPSATSAIFRKMSGAQDTNQNNTDFQTGVPNPRRTAPIVELGPWVAGTEPITDGTNVPYDATVTIDFSEPVDVVGSWYDISCTSSGQHNSATVASYNGFKGFHITPNNSFQFGEQCTVTVFHASVHDQDSDDSNPDTDTLFADHSWTFTIVGAGAPAPYAPGVHLAMGNPSDAIGNPLQPNNYLMEKPTYAASYNRDKGTPNWVSWHLDQDWFGSLARVDTFRADPAVPADWYRVQSTDYFSTGFDRGHMTPNADRDNETRIPINQETYLMTNMVPQAPDNNQGPWANMENDLRTILNGNQNEMYVVSGPLGVGGSGSNGGVTNTVADGHVTVPAFTWKVVLVLPKGDNDVSRVSAATRTIAVLMPNVQGIRNNDWHMYLTTVDNIESLTGYDFFANVPDAIENAIEAGTDGNNPPGTENQFATVAEDVPTLITLNTVSPLVNPTYSYTIVNAPSHGVLSETGPGFNYTPATDYNGTDSFTFRVNDGSHDSNTSTVNITVTDVNDAPVAADDNASTNEDTPLNISAIDLASNDSAGPANESLQSLTVTTVTQTADTHGSVALNSGVITYTPDDNYHGPASFTYQVCDNGTTSGAPDSRCTSANVNVTVNSLNDNPEAVDDSASTNEDNPVTIDVVANDTDVDGDSRTLQSVGTAGHGLVAIVSGQAQYSPSANFHGSDSFTYVVSDGHGGTATGTVNITVNSVNDNPGAVDDSVSTNEDNPVTIDVVANDTDVDGDSRTLQTVGNAAHGSVSIVAGQAQYSPNSNFHGSDSFTYVVSDGHGGTASATVNITVNSVNDNPEAVDDSASTNEDNPVSIDVVANDTDVDGDARTLQSVGSAAHGSVNIVAGQAQYSPNANFHGGDSFTYVVSDGHGGTANGTVQITINPVNDSPSANSQSVSTAGNTPVGIALSGNDVETLTANLTYNITVNPTHGTVSGTGTNRTYTPALNYSGPDSFKFTVTDSGDGSSATLTSSEATVSITVNDTIKPTVSAPANLNIGTGAGATTCGLLISDATLGTATANDNSGVVSIQRTGIPTGNIFPVGTTVVTYTATDGAGNTATATQTVVVSDTTAPNFSAPAPITVNADSNGHASVPNFVSGLTAQENCGGAVTFTQSPTAGTVVGIGTHTITITATDQAGNSTSRTTTFTVQANNGALVFSLDVSPGQAKRGKSVKLRASYANNTGALQTVTFKFKYNSPCGDFIIGDIGPMQIGVGAHGNESLPLLIPTTACIGEYSITLEAYVGGQLVGTTTATLNVTK